MFHSRHSPREASGRLVFIIGMQRSGTSWLHKSLSRHPEILTTQESHLFDGVVAKLVANWENTIEKRSARCVGLPAYFKEEEFYDWLRRAASSLYEALPTDDATRCIVDKTPEHCLHVPLIDRLFPEARYVALHRDPEDVVESLLAASRTRWGSTWASKGVLSASKRWKRYNSKAREGLAGIPRERVHYLGYEDMRRDFDGAMKAVLDFLDLDSGGEVLERMKSDGTSLPLFGEYRRSGREYLEEPEGFRRPRKGKLNMFQRWVVRMATNGGEASLKPR